MGIDRSKFSGQQLSKRAEESYRKKDDSGKFGSIFAKDSGLKFWKCKEGDHLIDIIPYLASENHPSAKKGEVVYILDLWVHNKVGVNEDTRVCMARTYSKPCPICEHANMLRKRGDVSDDVIKELSPKRRAIYNVMVYDNQKEQDQGVQVWDASHFLTEKNIIPLARNPRGGGFIAFADIDNGMSISFSREGSGQFNTAYTGYRFVDRDYAIDDETLAEAACLEDHIDIPDYSELKQEFLDSLGEVEDDSDGHGIDMGDDVPMYDDPPAPSRGRGRQAAAPEPAPAPSRGRGRQAEPEPAAARGRGAAKPAAAPEKPAAPARKPAKPKAAPVEEDLPEYEEDLANAVDDLDADLAPVGADDDLDMPADDLMDGGPENDEPLEDTPPTPTRRAAAQPAGGARRESLRPTGRTRA